MDFRGGVPGAEPANGWGDGGAFGAQVEPYRRELHLHCYRLLGSFDEAEDLVQETFLRAWRGRSSFEGRAALRAWLYRIATNACLDFLRRTPRRAVRHEAGRSPFAEMPWLQPYPDRLLDELASREAEPDAVVVARETVELAFLAAIQLLPPRQRAALILADVLSWSAAETASLLDTSVAAVNSALQRARATLQKHRPASRLAAAPAAVPSEAERTLLRRYMEATERADLAAFVALLREDVRCTMPPTPVQLEGRDSMGWMLEQAFGKQRVGDWRCLATAANRSPAAACYLRRRGDTAYRAFSVTVLRVEDGAVAELTAFVEQMFPAFGLPLTL
ncbi:MAG TPA: RNA polymerase subunit sigma-70 [Chloroflexota bacterium]|nr:RNA polymerase subunit sigma-70 [Chloroflexota bacterium]